MIGAIVMIFAAVWIYQSAMKAGISNVIIWVGGCMAVFLASQVLLIDANVYLLEWVRGGEGDANYERDLTSVGDRKNEGGFQGGSGFLLSVFMELMPPAVGFIIVALIRAKFIVKEKIALTTLFDGVGGLIVGGFKSISDTLKQGVKKS
ncbi:MAG: hypothetical protein EPN89_06240 [Methylovulum sp.]|jgi:hypothetical protein|nr:MAG: hypothetical protein EPN89_06240 [Methylovulum sp.]